METLKSMYQGDKMMLTKVADILQFDTRTQQCLKNENITYLGQLLTQPEGELLRVPNLGRKSLNLINNYLETISSSNRQYMLGSVEMNASRLSTPQQIKDYFEIDDTTQESVKGFCADDFEIVAASMEEHLLTYKIEFKDKDHKEIWCNLVKDNYIKASDNGEGLSWEDTDESVIKKIMHSSHADIGVTDGDIEVCYSNDDLKTLAEGCNILENFAKAINIIVPKAQKRAVKGVNKLYGISPA